MKITSLEIERFGLWAGLTLPALSDGINVFYGANETGKSTLLEFIRAILYGFGSDRQRFIRTPGKTNRSRNSEFHAEHAPFIISGGLLQMETRNGDQYHIRRTYLPDRTGNEDQIDIQTPDGTKQGTQLLRSLVSGVDEQTFNNIFAIGLDELQRLASLNDTEAAEMLFRLSVGLDRISIVDTIKELSARRNKILNIAETEGKPSLLTQLLVQREKIIAELSDSKLLIRQYVQLRNEQRVLDRTVANLEDDHTKLQREKRLYEIALNAEPIWLRRDKVRDEINAMGAVVAVAESVVQELDGIEQELSERRAAYDTVKDEYQKAKKAIAALPVNEKVSKLAPRIEILLEDKTRIVELDEEIANLESEIDSYNKRITEEESHIRKGRYPLPKSDVIVSPEQPNENASSATLRYGNSQETVQAHVLQEYRTYAKAVNFARKRFSKVQGQHAELQHRSRDLNDRLKIELAKRESVTSISEAVDRASETVSQLRRRQSIGQKMTEMMKHHQELRRINTFLMQNQALPGWMLGLMVFAGLGGVSSITVGVCSTALGITIGTALSVVLIIVGCCLIGVPILAKIRIEKNNSNKLADNQQQLAMLSGQIDRAKQEAAAIDARFPFANAISQSTSLEVRLQEAQQELVVLEKLMPVETQRQEVGQRLKQAEVRLQQSKEENVTATKRWNDWLRRVGLPSDWTPARIRDYLEKYDVVGDLRKELDKRVDTVNQRIKDIKIITNRIDNLIADIGLTVSDGASYVEIFGEIREALEANNVAIAKREKLMKGIKEFRKMRRKVVSDLQKAKQQESDLLRQFGVKTPEELRALHQRHQKHRRLLIQEQGIQRELDAAIGNFCSEDALGKLLEPRIAQKRAEQQTLTEPPSLDYDVVEHSQDCASVSLPEIADLLKDITKRIEISSAKLSEELQNRGQLIEQIKRVAEDQSATQKQRELAIVNEKIRQAQSEWQVYAVCARMLDEIRTTYERDRQPRTLAEASELLKQLTDERYHRIWTPLGEETLLVDDKDGQTFDVSWLSRGAREQLFIAIRLALASEFARHGSNLPLILDDVLVNFDSRRAWLAIQVLQAVAAAGSGRQIFLFTCHEHVCRMFQKMDIPVKILPPVEHPNAKMRVLQPRSVLERQRQRRLRHQRRLEADRTQRKIANELAMREESIRLDAIRRAEVQRLVVQMQQQATAEKAFEAENTQVHR